MAVVGVDVLRIDPGEVLRAVEWLGHARNHSATSALDYLEQLRSSTAILDAYRRMFPALWACSAAPTSGYDDKYPAHSPREGEFLRIMSRHYFYLPEDDGWMDEEQHYDSIPVTPMQGDSWCCGDFEVDNLRACFHVTIGLNGGTEYWEHVAARYGLDPGEQKPVAEIDYFRYKELCQAEPTALKHLPFALDLMSYDTGNVWLDNSFCQPQTYYPWTVPNILKLSREFKEARRAYDKMDELDRYLDNNPQEAVPRALELWNASARNKNHASSSIAAEGQGG